MGVNYYFVWGAGGVGKTHTLIRATCLAEKRKLLLTLDPSLRLFHLLNTKPSPGIQNIQLGEYSFDLRQTDALHLFSELEGRIPASPEVREYFRDLVLGLQRFRDYLSLIELGDLMRRADYDSVFIDTPPFQEARHFQTSILTLHEFFDRSLVQVGMRNQFLQMGVRKVLDGLKLFTGKANLEKSLAFLDWLSQHLERFRNSADSLHALLFSEQTTHMIVLTPESSINMLEQMSQFFSKAKKIEFVINRSVSHFRIEHTKSSHPVIEEFRRQLEAENRLTEAVQKLYQPHKIEKIPLQVMGEDTTEELLEFIGSKKAYSTAV